MIVHLGGAADGLEAEWHCEVQLKHASMTHSHNLSSVMFRPIPSYGYQLIIRPRRLPNRFGSKAEMALMLGQSAARFGTAPHCYRRTMQQADRHGARRSGGNSQPQSYPMRFRSDECSKIFSWVGLMPGPESSTTIATAAPPRHSVLTRTPFSTRHCLHCIECVLHQIKDDCCN
jgi:hypothetical protein